MCCACRARLRRSLELSLGARAFLSAAVAAEASVPQVCWASVHMEAMGLWRPLLDPVGWT